jgi:hypothetical protein
MYEKYVFCCKCYFFSARIKSDEQTEMAKMAMPVRGIAVGAERERRQGAQQISSRRDQSPSLLAVRILTAIRRGQFVTDTEAAQHRTDPAECIRIVIRFGQAVHETQLKALFGQEFTARYPATDSRFHTLMHVNAEGRLYDRTRTGNARRPDERPAPLALLQRWQISVVTKTCRGTWFV